MTDTNLTQIGLARETVAGTPVASPRFRTYRNTGQPGLGANPSNAEPGEIRSDRQQVDYPRVSVRPGGDLGFVMSFDPNDLLFDSAFQNPWTRAPLKDNITADSAITDVALTGQTFTIDADGATFKARMLCQSLGFADAVNNQDAMLVASNSGTTVVMDAGVTLANETAPPAGATLRVVGFMGASGDITATTAGGNALLSTTLDFTTMQTLIVGSYVLVDATLTGERFATAGMSGWCKISAIAANRLSFSEVPAAWATDAGTGKTIKVWTGDVLRNGVTKLFNTLERQFQGHASTLYDYYYGGLLGATNIAIEQGAIINGSHTMAFLTKPDVTDTRLASATDAAAHTNSIMTASSGVAEVRIGGSIIATENHVLSLQMSINNALRGRGAVGTSGLVGIGTGGVKVEGQITTYFDEKALYLEALQNNKNSIFVPMIGGGGRFQTLHIPSAQFTGDPDVSGPDSDVTLPLAFQASADPTLDFTAETQQFHYGELSGL